MTKERRDQVRASGRRMYWRRRKAGLCVECERPAEDGHVRCAEHHAYKRQFTHRPRPGRYARYQAACAAAGRCERCGGRAEPPKRLDSDREARRRCTDCRLKVAEFSRGYHGPKAKARDKCGACGVPGHKRPTCPRLLEQQRDQVQMSTGLGNWSW